MFAKNLSVLASEESAGISALQNAYYAHPCLRLDEQRSTRYHCWNHCTHLCSRTQVTKIWRNICNTKASLLLQILWGFSFEVWSPMKSEGGASSDIFFFLNLPCIILVKLNPSFWSKLYSLYLCPYCSPWSPPKVLQTFGHLLNLLLTIIQLSFRTVPSSAPRVWDSSHVILAPAYNLTLQATYATVSMLISSGLQGCRENT